MNAMIITYYKSAFIVWWDCKLCCHVNYIDFLFWGQLMHGIMEMRDNEWVCDWAFIVLMRRSVFISGDQVQGAC